MPKFLNQILISFAAFTLLTLGTDAQTPTQFRVGERITYSVSFDQFDDIAYAEMYTVSRGAISGKDAVELRWKLKTLNFASAAFYQINETRTVFAAPDSCLPLYTLRTESPDGIPKETIADYTKNPAVNFDLVTLIYKIRQSDGSGAANFFEGDRVYSATFQSIGSEKVVTPAGEFETAIVTVQSEYLTELGINDLKINLSNDEAMVPAMVRFKIAKRSFVARASSIQSIVPEPTATPTPPGSPTPRPVVTPTPVRTPEPYVPNQALSPELTFALGETLEYCVTAAGRSVGSFVTRVRERVQVLSSDTLVLSATVTNSAPGNPLFNLNDSIIVNADPITLAPRMIEIKLSGTLAEQNQTAVFDERTGVITYKGTGRVDAPIATHSILSLIYAMRSFNLKPSKTLDNPVNDTRVAVFWDSQPYVFTLRPSDSGEITLNGQRRAAQLITINTGNLQLDQLAIKVWLSNDDARVPLRFSVGAYQADLVSATNIPPQ